MPSEVLSDEQVSEVLQDITDQLISRAPDDELTHFVIRDEMARLRPNEMTSSELNEIISDQLRHLASVLEDFWTSTQQLNFPSGGHQQENHPMKPDIISAISLLREGYGELTDPTGAHFVSHPLAVLEELHSSGITDEVVLSASILHDILLYTHITGQDIRQSQGDEVAEMVTSLHYDLSLPTEELKEHLIQRTSGLSGGAQTIVIADLTTNLRWMKTSGDSEETQMKRVRWSEQMMDQITDPHPVLAQRFQDAVDEFSDEWSYPVSENTETSDQTTGEQQC